MCTLDRGPVDCCRKIKHIYAELNFRCNNHCTLGLKNGIGAILTFESRDELYGLNTTGFSLVSFPGSPNNKSNKLKSKYHKLTLSVLKTASVCLICSV